MGVQIELTPFIDIFPTKRNLKILLEKCTNPVYAIAISVGKKIIITGVRIVPNPKPEKKVSIAAPKVTTDTMNISIMKIELKSNLHLKIFLCKT